MVQNLIDFVSGYKGHNLKLLFAKDNVADKKKLRSIISNNELGKF